MSMLLQYAKECLVLFVFLIWCYASQTEVCQSLEYVVGYQRIPEASSKNSALSLSDNFIQRLREENCEV